MRKKPKGLELPFLQNKGCIGYHISNRKQFHMVLNALAYCERNKVWGRIEASTEQ
jgi:hypothetical protein